MFLKPMNILFGSMILMEIEDLKNWESLKDFFDYIWLKRREKDAIGYFVYCFETGTKLREKRFRFNTRIYHHVLLKSKYEQFKFKEWNIAIVHPDVHDQVHANEEKTPRLEIKKKELLKQIINEV